MPDSITDAPAGKRSRGVLVVLALILLFALHVRFLGLGEGLPYIHHWDEPYCAGAGIHMLKTGDFNPHFFDYPSFMMYSCLAVDALHYFWLMRKAPHDPDYLTNLRALQTGAEPGWIWEVSHPSFYLWNRAYVAVHGVLSVLLVFLIARRLFGAREALLAALMLAGFEFPVEHSRFITPNVPVGTFVLLTVLFSIRYYRSGGVGDLMGSGIAAGLACGTKYNAAVCMAVPLLAACLRPGPAKVGRFPACLLLLVIPVLTFFALTPYALLDLPTFLDHAGHDIRHYGVVEGSGRVEKIFTRVGAVVTPGLPHLKLQMGRIMDNVGWPVFFLAGLGAVAGLRRGRPMLLCLVFPLLYVAFMVQQKVGFHRNLVVVYSFIAILAAHGMVVVTGLLSRRRERGAWRAALVFLLCLLVIAPGHLRTWKDARQRERSVETRSLVVDRLNRLPGMDHRAAIGIARELRLHPRDLRRIRGRHQIDSHENLMRRIFRYDYLLVGDYECHAPESRDEDRRLNNLTPRDRLVATIGWGGKMRRDVYSVNPDVLILRGKWNEPIPPEELSLFALAGAFTEDPRGTVLLRHTRTNRTPPLRLAQGRYRLALEVYGARSADGAPGLHVLLGDRLLRTLDTEASFREEQIDFSVDEDTVERLSIRLIIPDRAEALEGELPVLAKTVERMTGWPIVAEECRGVRLALSGLRDKQGWALFTAFAAALEEQGYTVIQRDGTHHVVPLPGTRTPEFAGETGSSAAVDAAVNALLSQPQVWLRRMALQPLERDSGNP